MQDAIFALKTYWAKQGCLIFQPMNTEVGAGTANPATFLRALGPKPWKVAYAEPSIRPDDSRYGINPNRLQCHTQFQVLLKPDPGNPQEMYLESLEHIGIDSKKHDIRFVEDNWESPPLGAWGVGWEVWLNGLEITQFTYFQQIGSKPVDPISVEITYGMERIIMALQEVNHFKDIRYSDDLTYGDLFLETESEMSSYYLEKADIERHKSLIALYRKEAKTLLDNNLPLPAYTYILKCSHAFNVLDARGAISTTERSKAFASMRDLIERVAGIWIKTQQASFQEDEKYKDNKKKDNRIIFTNTFTNADANAEKYPKIKSPVLLEIGLEEIPGWQQSDTKTIRECLNKQLEKTSLSFGEISIEATPRRIVIQIEDMNPRETDSESLIRGPKLKDGFDKDKNPTKALMGFLEKNQAKLHELETNEKYVFIRKTHTGKKASDVLERILGEFVLEIRGSQNMRWNDPNLLFSRPIRWLLAFYGQLQLSVKASNLVSGASTRILRQSKTPIVEIETADKYEQFLMSKGIILSRKKRKEAILNSAEDLVKNMKNVEIDFTNADDITGLLEAPVSILCSFDEKYLKLPEAVLKTVIQKQKCLVLLKKKESPVEEKGKVHNQFIAFANGPCDTQTVKSGNETVIRARFEDALFFQTLDLKSPPQELHKRLKTLIYEDRLGSVYRRSLRIKELATRLADTLGLDEKNKEIAIKAASIAKFDLASHMVIEMPELAGYIAKVYAKQNGESSKTAQALEDMQLPSGPGKPLPVTQAGAILSIADRLDQLVSMFSIGAVSTGSSDPLGMRRIANGLVLILESANKYSLKSVGVENLVQEAVEILDSDIQKNYVSNTSLIEELPDKILLIQETVEFIMERWEKMATRKGFPENLVKAARQSILSRADEALLQVKKLSKTQNFLDLSEAIKRIDRICKSFSYKRNDVLLTSDQEKNLVRSFEALKKIDPNNLEDFCNVANNLSKYVREFFESTLVMTNEIPVREARLALLGEIRNFCWRYLRWNHL